MTTAPYLSRASKDRQKCHLHPVNLEVWKPVQTPHTNLCEVHGLVNTPTAHDFQEGTWHATLLCCMALPSVY